MIYKAKHHKIINNILTNCHGLLYPTMRSLLCPPMHSERNLSTCCQVGMVLYYPVPAKFDAPI